MVEWFAILVGAAEIVSASRDLVGFAQDIYNWFRRVLGESDDQQARKVWDEFKKDPEKHKETLAKVAERLRPDGDPVLQAYVLGLTKQKLQANQGQVYALLSGGSFTFGQVEHICRALGVDRSKNYTQADLASAVVELARTREALWDKLISLMLESNPEIIADIVKLA
jgi:hypothetical protein